MPDAITHRTESRTRASGLNPRIKCLSKNSKRGSWRLPQLLLLTPVIEDDHCELWWNWQYGERARSHNSPAGLSFRPIIQSRVSPLPGRHTVRQQNEKNALRGGRIWLYKSVVYGCIATVQERKKRGLTWRASGFVQMKWSEAKRS